MSSFGGGYLRIEIECPYCFKIHVHTINTEVKPKVDSEERELPQDKDTDDLEEYAEEKE